jgi:hypothetical protein
MAIKVRVVKIKRSELASKPKFILKILDGMKTGLTMADPEYCIYLTAAENIPIEEAKIGAKNNSKTVKFTEIINGFDVFSDKGNPPRDNEL